MQHTDVIDKWKVPIIESNKIHSEDGHLYKIIVSCPITYTQISSAMFCIHIYFLVQIKFFFNILQYSITGLIQHWVIFFYLFSPSQYLDLSRHYSCQNTFWDPGHNIQTQALVSFHYEEHHVACIIWKKRRTKFG